jgi:hypothetical protein
MSNVLSILDDNFAKLTYVAQFVKDPIPIDSIRRGLRGQRFVDGATSSLTGGWSSPLPKENVTT